MVVVVMFVTWNVPLHPVAPVIAPICPHVELPISTYCPLTMDSVSVEGVPPFISVRVSLHRPPPLSTAPTTSKGGPWFGSAGAVVPLVTSQSNCIDASSPRATPLELPSRLLGLELVQVNTAGVDPELSAIVTGYPANVRYP